MKKRWDEHLCGGITGMDATIHRAQLPMIAFGVAAAMIVAPTETGTLFDYKYTLTILAITTIAAASLAKYTKKDDME